MIEANWGDFIEVTVRNNIFGPSEGTAMHWLAAVFIRQHHVTVILRKLIVKSGMVYESLDNSFPCLDVLKFGQLPQNGTPWFDGTASISVRHSALSTVGEKLSSRGRSNVQ